MFGQVDILEVITIRCLFSWNLWRWISFGSRGLRISCAPIAFYPGSSGSFSTSGACFYLSIQLEFLSTSHWEQFRLCGWVLWECPKSYDFFYLPSLCLLPWNWVKLEVHDIGVSSGSIAGVVEGPSFDGYVGWVNPASSWGGVYSYLKLAPAELVVSPEVASIVKVDVGISACAVNSVVALFGFELNITRLHK